MRFSLFPFLFAISFIETTAGIACDTTILGGDLGSQTPRYVDIRTMPTDLDRAIKLFGAGCSSERFIAKFDRYRKSGPCPIVKTLAAKFYEASTRGPLLDYLRKNYFTCKTENSEITCTNTIRFINETPRLLSGEHINPNIEDTYATKVCFVKSHSNVLNPKSIRVGFIRIEEQYK